MVRGILQAQQGRERETEEEEEQEEEEQEEEEQEEEEQEEEEQEEEEQEELPHTSDFATRWPQLYVSRGGTCSTLRKWSSMVGNGQGPCGLIGLC